MDPDVCSLRFIFNAKTITERKKENISQIILKQCEDLLPFLFYIILNCNASWSFNGIC